MEHIKLNNGVNMPQLGFGVWKVTEEDAVASVEKAIEVGYRSIDTAMIYRNEVGVSKAIANANVSREELFITTKLWNADQGYESTLKAFDESLEKLGLETVDLYLIHWPTPLHDKYIETYKALEKLYKDGRVKAIGVSNFDIDHLQRVLDECEIVPTINQVELHPYFQQKELRAFCEQHNIKVTAFSPLMNGREVLQDEVITKIAERHGKTPAQVILRWHLQLGVIAIPKSITPSRIEENFNVFDFELSTDDMEKMASLDKGIRINGVPNEVN